MKKFMLLHIGFEQPTPEIMEAWKAWFASIADRQIDKSDPSWKTHVPRPPAIVNPPLVVRLRRPWSRALSRQAVDEVLDQGCGHPGQRGELHCRWQ